MSSKWKVGDFVLEYDKKKILHKLNKRCIIGSIVLCGALGMSTLIHQNALANTGQPMDYQQKVQNSSNVNNLAKYQNGNSSTRLPNSVSNSIVSAANNLHNKIEQHSISNTVNSNNVSNLSSSGELKAMSANNQSSKNVKFGIIYINYVDPNFHRVGQSVKQGISGKLFNPYKYLKMAPYGYVASKIINGQNIKSYNNSAQVVNIKVLNIRSQSNTNTNTNVNSNQNRNSSSDNQNINHSVNVQNNANHNNSESDNVKSNTNTNVKSNQNNRGLSSNNQNASHSVNVQNNTNHNSSESDNVKSNNSNEVHPSHGPAENNRSNSESKSNATKKNNKVAKKAFKDRYNKYVFQGKQNHHINDESNHQNSKMNNSDNRPSSESARRGVNAADNYVKGINDARRGIAHQNSNKDYQSGYNAFKQADNNKLPKTGEKHNMSLVAALLLVSEAVLSGSIAADRHYFKD